MKYLEVFALDQVARGLSHSINGVRVSTVIEAFSCSAGSDKKLYKSMDSIYSDLATSPDPAVVQSLCESPFGPLTEISSRKTLIFLVATLNSVFPDFDFSGVRPEEFRNEGVYKAIDSINVPLGSTLPHYQASLRDNLWNTLDKEICLRDCAIYSFNPEPETDPLLQDGYLWAVNYFFFNRRLNRVVFFRSHAARMEAGEAEDEDYDMGEAMSGGSSGAPSITSSDSLWTHDPDLEFMLADTMADALTPSEKAAIALN
mmetsp:Transcript_1619/g.4413  ORF Transcript_1619/g.4413 Transcript_1619/m.4413 type:complete len:258 (+) Transcript_1619:313-1086(+)|eukprot:CAMPEP_0119119702 /NCGR_PEP_ID=MMETSP1310-20130426/1064_1 /TAXON_ID=464262 /ORGANISM="Genus nov. species nov., Strain RCC2339" /LENGTH=257 /DNA_ID=CAMNT_0007109149 /DNA_START=428 /DNA_END=1201 /DNA_ORIENTATION=-